MSEVCPTCGREFPGKRGMRVHHASAHGKKLPNRACANCDTEFYSEEDRKYCSDECREASVSFVGENNPNYRGGKETTDCEICGEKFDYYPSEKPGKYCPTCVETENWRHQPEISGEDHPRWSGGIQEHKCDVCGDTFERHPNNITGKVAVCSRDCQYDWLSEAFTGDGHPNWKGGDTGSYGPGWNAVRRQALKRDGYECVVCGTTGEELGRNPDVHHIVPVRAFAASPDHTVADAHYLGNVVSLCVVCHRKAEFGGISRERLRRAAGTESPDAEVV